MFTIFTLLILAANKRSYRHHHPRGRDDEVEKAPETFEPTKAGGRGPHAKGKQSRGESCLRANPLRKPANPSPPTPAPAPPLPLSPLTNTSIVLFLRRRTNQPPINPPRREAD